MHNGFYITVVATVSELHTIRTALGSFFFYSYAKPARDIAEQLQLLKDIKMLFRDEIQASHFLENISYYRLKGYWWDMQQDRINHIFNQNTYF